MNILRSLKPYQRWQPGATILGQTARTFSQRRTKQGRRDGRGQNPASNRSISLRDLCRPSSANFAVKCVSGNSLTAKIAKKFRRGRKEKT